MLPKYLLTIGSVLSASMAITITAPKQGAKWDFSGSNTITWNSDSTDPDSFEIVRISPKISSMAQSMIVDSVNTSDGKYTFSNFVTPVADDYQINFIGNSASYSGIITQSQSFAVIKSGVNTTTSSASATATGTASGTAAK
ncbi:hypothetical protein VP1G_10527 [Cytospora mali]|uniref:Yeast cell wall synthesis Kre9/Knh1-like N-terminal domain-containing protein n=1 Tax=Cytospora mali TaxID=578113 RepID=A0A194UNG0_CYTMA|nr:hypothetical protein VP1G_10527 [Valsa mali var. pyri (nom. inval.)]